MGLPQRTGSNLTVRDYLASTDESRWELIDGVVWDMSPAPVIRHQRISADIFRALFEAMNTEKTKAPPPGCEVLYAPIDVVLGDITVVQPDIVVVCDPAKLANGKYVDGAPDVVIEILSPSTAKKDRSHKLRVYQRAAVPEYLIVDPYSNTVERYVLQDGKYCQPPDVFGTEDEIVLGFLPGYAFQVGEWLAE
ncbi:MAG: Uma2 family endonuclease [Sulfuricellaceae bacterium]